MEGGKGQIMAGLVGEPILGYSVGPQSTDPSVKKLLQNGSADSSHPTPHPRAIVRRR